VAVEINKVDHLEMAGERHEIDVIAVSGAKDCGGTAGRPQRQLRHPASTQCGRSTPSTRSRAPGAPATTRWSGASRTTTSSVVLCNAPLKSSRQCATSSRKSGLLGQTKKARARRR